MEALVVADRSYNAPDYRWRMVEDLVAEKREPARSYAGDELTRKAWRFLKRRKPARLGDLPQLRHDYPHLYEVYEVNAAVAAKSPRWVLEAALLTTTPFPEVADFVDLSTEVVEAYHNLLFAVRPHLRARGWVLSWVLGPMLAGGAMAGSPDFLFKLVAYCGGWNTFKEYLDRRDMTDDGRAFLQVGFKDGLLKKGWESVQRVEVNNFTALPLIEQTVKLIEIEQSKGGAGARLETDRLLNELLNTCTLEVLKHDSVMPQDELRPKAHALAMLPYGAEIPLTPDPNAAVPPPG